MDARFSQAAGAYGSISKMQVEKRSPQMPEMPTLDDNGKEVVSKATFDELLSEALKSAKGAGYKSEEVSVKALKNEADLHELVTAVTNAELTLQTIVAIRDKAINAYQDIIKMPI